MKADLFFSSQYTAHNQRHENDLCEQSNDCYVATVEELSSNSPLDEWRFLVGTWKGKTPGGQFGERGVIEGEALFSCQPSDSFIMGTGENRCEGRLLNKSISILFYDDGEKKFRRKTFFSYGFVNNEVECERTRDMIKFDITTEPLSRQVGPGMRWRSTIRKISDTVIATGLEMAKPGKDFKSYGEERLEKTK